MVCWGDAYQGNGLIFQCIIMHYLHVNDVYVSVCVHLYMYDNWYIVFWVILVGLLTPLTFAWHRLSPLATFTSGVYFLHNGRR